MKNNYRTVKMNLTKLNKNEYSNTEQFMKFPSRLTYDESGLKMSEQYLMMLFMDRMQSSYKNGYQYFDLQMQQFYVRFTRQQLMDKTGIKSASTISSKLSSLKDKNLIHIKYLTDYVMEIFLPTFVYKDKDKEEEDDSKIKNETSLFIFVPRLKIKRGVFENCTGGVQKSNNNHSIYSYVFKSYVINNRTVLKRVDLNKEKYNNKQDIKSRSNNELGTNGKQSSNNKSNKEQDNNSMKQSNANINNHSSKNSYTTVKGFMESLDNNKFPKESLHDLEQVTTQLAYTDTGKANVMQNVVDKVFQAKQYAGKALKIEKDFFWWENNQQLTNDFIKKFYNLVNYVFDKRNHVKSYKGYIYKSLVAFFEKIGKRYLGIEQPENKYSYPKVSKHPKNKNSTNGRGPKRIKEKKRDWAKDNYQRRVKFEDQSPEIQNLIANNWNKATWSELNNNSRYVEIDESGFPYADSKGSFCKKPGAGSLEKIYDATKATMNKAEAKKKRDNFKAVRQIQDNYKENSKGYFDDISKLNDKEQNQSYDNKQTSDKSSDSGISEDRKAELKAKVQKLNKSNEESRQEEIDEALKSFGQSFSVYN